MMYDYYILEEGENLDSVCNLLHLDKKTIMDLNNVTNENDIRSGRQIKVPINDANYYNTYTIERGDTLYGIARKYNINPELLASMNGLNMEDYIYPNQEILIPKNNYSYYITKDGDSLDNVATMFKTNVPNLLKDNKTIYLTEGQILVHQKQHFNKVLFLFNILN